MSQGVRIRSMDDPAMSGLTRAGGHPVGSWEAHCAINRVRQHFKLPPVEEVSVFDSSFSDATDGVARVRRQCQRCRAYLVAGHRARKWCYACAAEVEQERKDRRDKARDRRQAA